MKRITMQMRSFAVGASNVTDVAVATTGALVRPCSRFFSIMSPSYDAVFPLCMYMTLFSQAKLQDKEWRGLDRSVPGAADANAAFATLVSGLSGCAWSYESEAK